TGLRFFTVYGPWGRPDMAPMLFAKAISTGKAIKVFNEGDMQRDFTYIDDVVEGVVRATEHVPTKHDLQPYYRLFNIGNSKPIQLMDFIRELEWALDKRAVLDMYPMQPGDVKITYADTSALKQATNYEPKTTIQDGVRNFVGWWKSYGK